VSGELLVHQAGESMVMGGWWRHSICKGPGVAMKSMCWCQRWGGAGACGVVWCEVLSVVKGEFIHPCLYLRSGTGANAECMFSVV